LFDIEKSVFVLQEQLHWAILISGHILANDSEGETPMIPSDVLRTTNTNDSPVLLIMNSIFQLLDSLCFPSNSIQFQATSPLLLETIFWFVNRWAASYLFAPKEIYSQQSNLLLVDIFAPESQGGQIFDYILNKLRNYLNYWYSDGDVVAGIVNVLESLSKNSVARDRMSLNESFRSMVGYLLKHLVILPSEIHRYLV
jgi:hypothetical protein